jgi:ring-1,2-phenylacetyl-CoA epoxidase subunit PaaE
VKQYTVTIQDIRKETKDSVTLSFKQPALRKIKYKAGQYITLILIINGRKYFRPYSLSSSPSVDSTLNITVKRVKDGIVSNYLNDNINIGDILELSGPYGDFTYDFDSNPSPLFLWGAGSGITPLYSILKEVLNKNTDTKVYLVYANRYQDSTIFRDELDELENLYTDRFRLTYMFSKEEISSRENQVNGRINEEFLRNYLIDKAEVLNTSVHYICGPNELKETIKGSLKNLSVEASNVYTEEFELSINEEDLYDVIQSHVSVKIKDQTHTLDVVKGKSLLDAFLDNNIEIPYSCQTGSCKECIARVISGETKILGQQNVNGLDKNQTLLCCTYPTSKEIEIEI